MDLNDRAIEDLVARYISDGSVVALGTSHLAEAFLKKIAFRLARKNSGIQLVPTSMTIAALASELRVPLTSIDEHEIDVAIEFVDQIDADYNFLKADSHSLIRDKMIAQSAEQMIAITEKKNLVSKLSGTLSLEIAQFGSKRTLLELSKFGRTDLKKEGRHEFKTESGNLLALVEMDAIYSPDDLEFQAKQIPGVIETGLFLGYADRMVLYNPGLEARSRIQTVSARR